MKEREQPETEEADEEEEKSSSEPTRTLQKASSVFSFRGKFNCEDEMDMLESDPDNLKHE